MTPQEFKKKVEYLISLYRCDAKGLSYRCNLLFWKVLEEAGYKEGLDLLEEVWDELLNLK